MHKCSKVREGWLSSAEDWQIERERSSVAFAGLEFSLQNPPIFNRRSSVQNKWIMSRNSSMQELVAAKRILASSSLVPYIRIAVTHWGSFLLASVKLLIGSCLSIREKLTIAGMSAVYCMNFTRRTLKSDAYRVVLILARCWIVEIKPLMPDSEERDGYIYGRCSKPRCHFLYTNTQLYKSRCSKLCAMLLKISDGKDTAESSVIVCRLQRWNSEMKEKILTFSHFYAEKPKTLWSSANVHTDITFLL